MNTVFNKAAKKKALNISPEKIVKTLQESMVIGPKGEIPRDYGDFTVSISLEDQEKLPLHNPLKINTLEAYLKDLKEVNEKYKIDKVIVFDTETTGYNGYAVSMAFILYSIKENKILKEYYSLVDPQVDIPEETTKIHGIKNEDIEGENTFKELWPEVEEMFNEADMAVGHNLAFDFKVLEREFDRINKINPIEGFPYFDTMNLSKQVVKAKDKNGKRIKDATLEECVEFYKVEITNVEYHNALVDTQATLEVFKAMLKYSE